jgi:hypothetical protein
MMLSNYRDRIIILLICLAYPSIIVAAESIGIPVNISFTQLQHYQQKNFKILGAIQLKQHLGQNDFPAEFSGLAWDHDENRLIILSDRGFIINAKPVFKNDQLIDVESLSVQHLKDANGNKLKHKAADSEGLALKGSNNNKQGDTELIVSFERKPRIVQYTSKGELIAEKTINNELNNITNYAGENKGMEAVTLHNTFNIITGPERPLRSSQNNLLSFHTLNNEKWHFTPDNENYGSLVGLTTLPDGRLIALERSFPGVFAGITNVIHLITLEPNSIQQEKLVKLQPIDGYFNENFEGISWHKHNRFFMISDDNNNIFQRTILIYFEIPSLRIKQD